MLLLAISHKIHRKNSPQTLIFRSSKNCFRKICGTDCEWEYLQYRSVRYKLSLPPHVWPSLRTSEKSNDVIDAIAQNRQCGDQQHKTQRTNKIHLFHNGLHIYAVSVTTLVALSQGGIPAKQSLLNKIYLL
tara:strand:- start:3616 stop:4008 length:393 start_codon:yes stop_codon:yes gene_type:complete